MPNLKIRFENGKTIPIKQQKGYSPREEMARRMDYFDALSEALKENNPPIYLDERIGKGGFSWVFQGSYTKNNRNTLCAVKMPHPEFARQRDPEQARLEEALFDSECTLHQRIFEIAPNVVEPYFFGSAGRNYEFPFIVLQLMQDFTGSNIAAQPCKYSLKERIGVVRDVARCLYYMHKRGYLHCDIKPENIFFPLPSNSPDGRFLKGHLGDFGLARKSKTLGTLHLKAKFGSLAYIAPEQVLTDQVDEKADQFSLGAVLYTFLSGQLPRDIKAGVEEELLVTAPIPIPSLLCPKEKALISIAMKAMEQRPENRFGGIAEMDHALGEKYNKLAYKKTPSRGLLTKLLDAI